MHARTVQIRFLEGFFEAVEGSGTLPPDAQSALGYLSHWAIGGDRFKMAMVAGDKDGNLHALYYRDDGTIGYEIFGQRAPDGTYSFHS